jgi:hypothetical protein
MALLAYCVVLDDGATKLPSEGLLDSRVELIAESGLIALCSELERSVISASNFQQAAVDFHHVVQAVFAAKAVIPFRFPTWLSAQEMRTHLRQESLRYKDFLIKHADQVQMEVRIHAKAAALTSAASGTEHLRLRAAQMRKINDESERIKNLVADMAIDWYVRETPDGTRLYALLSKRLIEAFREKLKSVPARITGPWPATEFFEPPRG